METIEIYYRLVPNSLLHGQFLVDMYALDPKATISCYYEHVYVTGTDVYAVVMLSEVAILQKLKYGDCLAGPKPPKPPKEEEKENEYAFFKKSMFAAEKNKIIFDSYITEIEKIKSITNFRVLKNRNSNNSKIFKIDFNRRFDEDAL